MSQFASLISSDTIVALATPPGKGGIGVIRLSGADAKKIAERIAKALPSRPHSVIFTQFHDLKEKLLDEGLVLFFGHPHSYTGEDIIELHAHGSPVVLDLLLNAAIQGGARLANPGEFTERAFLNGRLDLTQAEAVADLVEAGTEAAARAAMGSLKGEFSKRIEKLSTKLLELRVQVEGAIDFPEDEVDVTSNEKFEVKLDEIIRLLDQLLQRARTAQKMNEGLTVVLSGMPNAGKSSILNALAEEDRAIVTAIPGTTRDLVEATLALDGLIVRVIDTAGLRDSSDPIEVEGVRRARKAAESADLIVEVIDDSSQSDSVSGTRVGSTYLLQVLNKIDLTGRPSGVLAASADAPRQIALSAKTGDGLETLRDALKTAGGGLVHAEGATFSARRRHLKLIEDALNYCRNSKGELFSGVGLEVVAEDLGQAQNKLGEITGVVTTEDLLGAIFSTFCIGK